MQSFDRSKSIRWRTIGLVLFVVACVIQNEARPAGVQAEADNPFATAEEKAAASGPRTWSDASGKFKIEAKLVRVEDGMVVLRRTDDKQISVPLEKLCDADRKYLAAISGLKTPVSGSEPEAGKDTDSATKSGNQAGGSKIGLTPTDYTKAKSIDLAETGQWAYSADPWPASEKLPTVRVPLEAVDFFDRPQRILFVPKEKKAFVVYYEDFKKHSSIVQACNLESGKLDASAVFAQSESPVDISPDGALVLSRMEQWGEDREAELHLYNRDGNKVTPLAAWRPFQSSAAKEHESDTGVRWAAFTDSQHVLTLSTFGKLVLWEVPNLRPVWSSSAAFATEPVLSPGRKYLIVANSDLRKSNETLGRPINGRPFDTHVSGAIMILNVADGTEAGRIPLDREDLNISSLALCDDGQQLALGQIGRIRIWDLQTRDIVRDFALVQDAHPMGVQKLAWAGESHLLVNGNILVDAQRRIPVWVYDAMNELAVLRDGKVWYLEEAAGNKNRVLVSAAIPNKAVLDSVKNLKPDDLLVLHPGMELSLDVQQLSGDADEVAKAKQALEERLQNSGIKLVTDSKNRLVASVQPGKTVKVMYRSWHTPLSAAQEHQVTTQVLSLALEVGGESVWKYESSTSPPSMLQLKEGENVDQALQRVMQEQDSSLPKRCATVWIPSYLAKMPGGNPIAKSQTQPKSAEQPVLNYETFPEAAQKILPP